MAPTERLPTRTSPRTTSVPKPERHRDAAAGSWCSRAATAAGRARRRRVLAAWLRDRGVDGGRDLRARRGPTGAVLRELLLHGPEPLAPAAEALLMAADRAQHVATEIEPALARGAWVVCDRYVPSSLVYQGVVRGLGVDVVERLEPRSRPPGSSPTRARARRVRRGRATRAGPTSSDRLEARR